MHHRHSPTCRLLAWGALVLSLLMLQPSAFAQAVAPQLIPFQGRLTNQQGVAYNSGQYSITFNLYSQAVGGSTLWTERHEKVGITNGMVNVFLGSITALTAVDFATVKYLGITIDADNNPATADPEMVPRQMIIPAFAAKQAERTRTMDVLDANGAPITGQTYGWASLMSNGNPSTGTISGSKLTAASVTGTQLAANSVTTTKIQDGQITAAKLAATPIIGSGQLVDGGVALSKLAASVAEMLVPSGAVLPFAGSTAPTGYFFCDGRALSRTTYSALFAALGGTASPYGLGDGSTTFNLPDYRGMFLRGVADIPSVTITAVDNTPSGETVTVTGHPYRRNGVPVRLTGTLPAPLVANTTYYTIVVDANKVAFATTEANAIAAVPVKIDITGTTINGAVVQALDPDSANRRNPVGNTVASGVGSYQSDVFRSHSHRQLMFGTGIAAGGAPGQMYRFDQPNNYDVNNIENTGGNETRPVNAYVNYIIKY